MSTYKRKLFLCAIGIIAGIAAWPAAELLLYLQGSFPSYLVFSTVLGTVFGIFIGAFFGSGDGIITANRRGTFRGIKQGCIIGALGGAAGFLVGQAALFIIGEFFIHSQGRLNSIGLPLSRALGWACLGVFTGMIDGIRSWSANRIRVGIIGGIAGGLVGGLALEYLRLVLPGIALARLTGIVLLGLSIGFFYGLVESRLSFGVLTVLNGRFRGRDFVIAQHRLSIGASDRNDIVLEGYGDINNVHARIKVKKNNVVISPAEKGSPLFANEERVGEHILKFEDVLKIGSAKLLYRYK